MTIVDNTKIGNKVSRISKKREKPTMTSASPKTSSTVKQLKKNWRLVQLMTVLEDYQGVSCSLDNRVQKGALLEQPNYKNEVTYKNVYVTNPLVPMGLSTSVSTSGVRFPISAKFVAQWLSENIVSSKTYKLTLLCDRVIKAANLKRVSSTSSVKLTSKDGEVISKADKTLSKAPTELVGIKIIISGRILGAEIATSKTFKAGQIPSNTIDILKDSGFALAKTRSGTIGVKVIYFWKP